MSNKMEMERVIFRRCYDPYMKMEMILAVFPDDEANPGRLVFLPMYFNGNETRFECTNEMTYWYYLEDTKPLKDKELAEKCKVELEQFYRNSSGGNYTPKFRVMQKIMRR